MYSLQSRLIFCQVFTASLAFLIVLISFFLFFSSLS